MKEFAVFANFLHSLTQKDKKFVWSTNCETAGSRSLTKAERRYRVTRKELKRLYILSRRTDPIFMADVFVLRTDHSASKWMVIFKEQEGQLSGYIIRV